MATKTSLDSQPQYHLDRLLAFVKKHNGNNSGFNSWKEKTEFHNAWADYWRYYVGVNVIPSIGKIKRPIEKWEIYQDKAIPEEIHNRWKSEGRFNEGMAMMMGKIRHRKDLDGYYIAGIDADNLIAIRELLTRNGRTMTPEELAKNTIVEQHTNKEKLHFYVYIIGKPLRNKTSDIGRPRSDIKNVPALEVKASSDFLMFGSPCINKNTGQPYQILGTYTPLALNYNGSTEFQEFIDGICKKYGLDYDSQEGRSGDMHDQISMEALFKPGFPTLEGHNRHERILRMMESLLVRNRGILPPEQIKAIARTCNTIEYFDPPLNNEEFEKQWDCALKFILIKGSETLPGKEYGGHHLGSHSATEERIRDLAEQLMSKYIFKTLKDTEEILYFVELILSGGEQIIKIELEEIAGYSINNNKRNEIIGHIKYSTMVERQEFDKDLDITNVKNGLLNIRTGEIKQHTPDILSTIQLHLIYNSNAECPNILKFLSQVLHPQDLFTAMEIIGYVLLKSNKYEKAFMLYGSGDNGKSVFIKLIESFVGLHNTSHVTLQDLDMDRFSSADLYGKLVNTFADLPAYKLSSTGTFKTLVSGDSIRAQFKYGQPFSFKNGAKLIFSANKIPDSDDSSHAYYKRWLILAFENSFLEGSKDTNLIQKLTTPEELSGLLNLALIALRQLQKEGGFRDIPVEDVKRDYERKSNTVKAFLADMCRIDLGAPEYLVRTVELYEEYGKYCRQRKDL